MISIGGRTWSVALALTVFSAGGCGGGVATTGSAACTADTECAFQPPTPTPPRDCDAACPSGSTCTVGVCQTTTGTSCQTSGAGLTNCGSSSESCCTSIEVPGGTYYRTYTNSGSGPTGDADPATVSSFRLDKYDVTVGRFRQFVAAWNSGWLPSAGSGKHTHVNGGQGLVSAGAGVDGKTVYEPGWDAADWNNTTDLDPTDSNLGSCAPYSTWTRTAESQENLPINCVNWWESYAFCIWDGGFLPSEAEWEYAAVGGGGASGQREYPWGTTAPGTACPGTGCEFAIYNCNYPNASMGCTGVANIAPVGTAALGAGLWGQLDLAGNVWQWNLDWYAPYVVPCTDCAYLTAASPRVARGGGFDDFASDLLPPNRNPDPPPSGRSYHFGFRCARTP